MTSSSAAGLPAEIHQDLAALRQIGQAKPNDKLTFTMQGHGVSVQIDQPGIAQRLRRTFASSTSNRQTTHNQIHALIDRSISHIQGAHAAKDKTLALNLLKSLSEAHQGLKSLQQTYSGDPEMLTHLKGETARVASILDAFEGEAREAMADTLISETIHAYQALNLPFEMQFVKSSVVEFVQSLPADKVVDASRSDYNQAMLKSLKDYRAKTMGELIYVWKEENCYTFSCYICIYRYGNA